MKYTRMKYTRYLLLNPLLGIPFSIFGRTPPRTLPWALSWMDAGCGAAANAPFYKTR